MENSSLNIEEPETELVKPRVRGLYVDLNLQIYDEFF